VSSALPTGVIWHAKRVHGADVTLEDLTPEHHRRVVNARLKYLQASAVKAARARQRKCAEKLRQRLAAIEQATDNEEQAERAAAGEDPLPRARCQPLVPPVRVSRPWRGQLPQRQYLPVFSVNYRIVSA
jgi:hypothetical protein